MALLAGCLVSTGCEDHAGSPQGARPPSATPGSPSGDITPPAVSILTPREDVAIDERRLVVTGTATDDAAIEALTYSTNGGASIAVPIEADGRFRFELTPTSGTNTITVTAVDRTGHETRVRRTAYYGHRVSVGNSQSAMLEKGTLFTWGRNELGQLGSGTLVGTWSADETAALPPMYGQPAENLVSVVTRQTFMVALANDGTVRSWGNNASGQLGYSTPANCGSDGISPCGRTPAPVPGITDAVAIAAGFGHTLVLRSDGSVLAFGNNASGQLGLQGTTTTSSPTPVPGLARVIALAAGASHSAALTADGKVWVWGSNEQGQLGRGTTDTDPHPIPSEVPDLIGASIASGNNTMLVRLADGTVRAWGHNNHGQVGDGTTNTASKPTPVLVSPAANGTPAAPLTNVESIAADGFVSLALDHEGNGHAWGLGGMGQLAQGFLEGGERDLEDRTVASPLHVEPTEKGTFVIVELDVGAGGPAFARTNQQKLFGWGWSLQGSLGGGTTLLNAWAYTVPRLVYPLP